MAQDRAVQGEGVYRGLAGAIRANRQGLFGRVKILFLRLRRRLVLERVEVDAEPVLTARGMPVEQESVGLAP